MAVKSKKILLVEDEPAISEMYSLVFKKNGLDFDLAVNKAAAWELLNKNLYALLLLDLIIPAAKGEAVNFSDREGFNLLKALRGSPILKNLKVLMLTNLDCVKDRDIAKKLKAEYIVKAEVVPQQIVNKVKELLN